MTDIDIVQNILLFLLFIEVIHKRRPQVEIRRITKEELKEIFRDENETD